ncbi:DNA recombination protein RmuC [Arcanobacterium phocae]|uniref:DNA recombination protein RmuC n=1 Tax=Arcanobacterium phocae TaxID=131112 RepID=A0A1H2LEE8_9ACTO|nr:DNA recombination protein RmuC [Arcanobacterium phocae]SDU79105.1 DNA recombination protein RmuC [Arcanobacterium phocae]
MTIDLGVFLIFIAIALASGGAIGWFAALSQERGRAQAVRDELSQARADVLFVRGQAEQLERENSYLHEQIDSKNSTAQALAPISQQLGTVDSFVRALESKTTQQFSALTNQLQTEARVSAQLSRTTESLNAALRNSTVRGSWGEVQLRRIIEVAGMLERVDFDEQRANSQFSDSGQGKGRPDVTVHLPNGAHIAIDAKVPMASYLAAHDISETDLEAASERAELLRAHAKAVKNHVATLKKRNYPADFPHSPQLTIMFLPSEALLSEALEADSQLLEYALADGIILASPVSLLALLRSVAAVWRSAQASEQAQEIVIAGKQLVDRLSVFVGHLSKLGSSLSSSVTSYNKAVSSLESRVLVTYRKFDSLGDKATELTAATAVLSSDQTAIRELTATEFDDVLGDNTELDGGKQP